MPTFTKAFTDEKGYIVYVDPTGTTKSPYFITAADKQEKFEVVEKAVFFYENRMNDVDTIFLVDANCNLCKSVEAIILNYLGGNYEKEHVTTIVKTVCRILPTLLYQQCNEWLPNNSQKIIDYIVSNKKVIGVCTTIK